VSRAVKNRGYLLKSTNQQKILCSVSFLLNATFVDIFSLPELCAHGKLLWSVFVRRASTFDVFTLETK